MPDKRLIDANALLKSYDVAWMVEYDESGCGVRKKALPTKTIEEAPTIDAVEVVHGRWVFDRPNHYKCSLCDAMWSGVARFMKFCPNCGMPMDGGATDGSDA